MRRGIATLLTLGLLFSFLLAVVLGLMLYVDLVSLPLAVALVIVLNVVTLLVSPRVNDLIYGWLYDVEWVDPEEFRRRSPASMDVVDEVTTEYDYATPKLGIIPDRNPTAFTYGSGRYNARIVVTEGCFEYLEDDELASVVAHELGHITSRDFIIMTLANTVVQILYLVAVNSMKVAQSAGANRSSSASSKGNPAQALAIVGAVAYVLWFFSEYAVLYLSRTREYAADAFAAEYADADDLSMSLIKIALGLVESEDDPELLKATRNIGITSVEESKQKGIVYHNTREHDDMAPLLQALLFDLVSPWAHLLEIQSTHPLTGKRVRRLSERAVDSRFDFADIRERFPVDRRRLYTEFLRDLLVLSLPALLAVGFPLAYFGAVLADTLAFSWFTLVGGWLVAVGLAMLLNALYRYSRGEPEETTVLELLTDVYASPVDGKRVVLSGELIGRGTAGYRFSEDLMFQDDTGLMYLKYDSWLPLLGDFLFSVREVPGLIGDSVTVEGWYFRATSPWTGLRRLQAGDCTIKGFVHLGSYAGAALLITLGCIVLGVSTVV
jgi:Zn-dependent protease with chaperone function